MLVHLCLAKQFETSSSFQTQGGQGQEGILDWGEVVRAGSIPTPFLGDVVAGGSPLSWTCLVTGGAKIEWGATVLPGSHSGGQESPFRHEHQSCQTRLLR